MTIQQRVIDAVKERIPNLTINRAFDIPYLAGYSNDGKTIYIDRHVPHGFTDTNGKFHKTDKYLITHEATEKALEDDMGLKYQQAHRIATETEKGEVEGDRLDWDEYSRFMEKHIKEAGHEKLQQVPKELDLTPYEDENDKELIQKMMVKEK